MKVVQRSFLFIRAKQPFWNWARECDPDLMEFAPEETEGSVYLVEEDFFELDPILKKSFKMILETELSAVTDDHNEWPEKLTFELFESWFSCEYGNSTYDLEKGGIGTYEVEL